MWYDISKTLSYNCLFNFIIGNRGCGKTYGLKKYVIKDFLKKGNQFVYLRRFQDETEETAENYFNDIMFNNEFDGLQILYKNGCYFIEDKICGYAMSLTKAKNIKSSSFPLVNTIIFDEFLIEENGYTRYLKNEVKQFLGFYMSIDRYRGCKVFFLGNATTSINPYFLFWDLQLPYNNDIKKYEDILIHLVANDEFIKDRKKSRFGKLIQGTDFEEYAIDNKFAQDNATFIKKKTGKLKYEFTFIYDGLSFGVWKDEQNGLYFISEDIDNTCKFIFTTTTTDHKENTMLTKGRYKNPFFKNLTSNFKLGNVFFESQKIKNISMNVIKMFLY